MSDRTDPQGDGEPTNDYYLRKPKNLTADTVGTWNGFGVQYANVNPPGDTILTVSLADTIYTRGSANGTIGVNAINGRAGAVTLQLNDIPPATKTGVGGIKVGDGLSIAADGTLTANPVIKPGYIVDDIPFATSSTKGVVKIGRNLTIDASGVLSAVTGGYTLPTASTSVLGGIKIGKNLSIDGNGIVDALDSYKLPPATASLLGGVTVGTSLTVTTTGLIDVDPTKYVAVTQKGIKGGVATLDSSGQIPASQLPPVAIANTSVVAHQAERLGLSANVGDVVVQTDVSKTYILSKTPASTAANWVELLFSQVAVTSVNGKVGNAQLIGQDLLHNVYSYNGRDGAIAYQAGDVPNASSTSVGVVKVGANLTIAADGTLDLKGGGLKYVKIGQAAYTALAVKDPQTVYLISGA